MKKKKVFIKGAITPAFITEKIAKHHIKHSIGAHNIFLGQVRADQINGKKVTAINYSCYEEMAEKKLHEIRENAFAKYTLSCMHIYHSIGIVKAGEIGFVVFVSAKRRKEVFEATEYIVNQVKEKVPIFGKEILEDYTHQWKINH